METKDLVSIITLIFSAFAILISGWVAWKGAKPKMLLDGSAAAENFQEIVIKMQTRQDELEARLEGKQLRVHMTIEIDKAPVIDNWEWAHRNDIPTKPLPPTRRQNGGFGR